MRDLSGKRVLITGAARGIGRCQALEFARAGAMVIATDLDETALAELATELRQQGTGGCSTHLLDVTDEQRIREVRQEILAAGGPIDVLVNNAGVVFGGPLLEVPLDRHITTYRVNCEALVAVTYIFLPDLISRPQAHLVNIVSASAFIGLPFGSTYASSKWAAMGFSESLRLELAELGHHHVGVTSICPSFIRTGMFDGVKPPIGTQYLTPEYIGKLVVQSVQRGRPVVLTPWIANLGPAMRGVLPLRLVDWLGRRFGTTTTMKSWHGHAPRVPQGETPMAE